MNVPFYKKLGLRPGWGAIWRNIARQVILLGAVLAASVLATRAPAAVMAQEPDLSELPISFPIHAPEVAAYFDEMARPGDTASVPLDRLFLLSQMEAGEKMVAFRSWAEAQSQIDDLSGSVEWVMYNPEHWELTPEDEQEDLATIVQQFAEAVRARGMRFLFAPDRQYAELHLGQVAPYVDAVMLQGQRLQHDPQTFATWVLGMADVAHKANSDIQVYVQVGATRGTAEEMYTAIETVAGEIDGIAIWSMPRTLEILQEFMTLVRGAPPEATATSEATIPPLVEPTATPTVVVPTNTPAAPPPSPMPTITPTIEPTPTDQAELRPTEPAVTPTTPAGVPEIQTGQTEPLGGWVTSVLLFVGGVGVGLVLGFILGWSLRRGS
jgi:hypothetical protein